MYQFFLVAFLIVAVVLIVLIMLQQSKNDSFGGMFDNRSLDYILSSRSFGNGVTRLIVILAILFFFLSLLLGNMNSKYNQIYIYDSYQENRVKDK